MPSGKLAIDQVKQRVDLGPGLDHAANVVVQTGPNAVGQAGLAHAVERTGELPIRLAQRLSGSPLYLQPGGPVPTADNRV